MPSGKTHVCLAGFAGGGTAACFALDEVPVDIAGEVLGGALAGMVGGKLPDILEPALNPLHRSFFHSVIFGAIETAAGLALLTHWQSICREKAREHKRAAGREEDPILKFLHQLAAFAWHMLAGALPGFVAGYVSHLAADATTPNSLPVICR